MRKRRLRKGIELPKASQLLKARSQTSLEGRAKAGCGDMNQLVQSSMSIRFLDSVLKNSVFLSLTLCYSLRLCFGLQSPLHSSTFVNIYSISTYIIPLFVWQNKRKTWFCFQEGAMAQTLAPPLHVAVPTSPAAPSSFHWKVPRLRPSIWIVTTQLEIGGRGASGCTSHSEPLGATLLRAEAPANAA